MPQDAAKISFKNNKKPWDSVPTPHCVSSLLCPQENSNHWQAGADAHDRCMRGEGKLRPLPGACVKLVSYRVNDAGQHIGGIANVPDFTPGTGWVKNGDYYYYKQPVNPGEKPAHDLIGSINLIGSYTDADGGKQVIEVMAEAIQAKGVADDGTKAVVKAWGVDPETLS